jgi:hypothetical protein
VWLAWQSISIGNKPVLQLGDDFLLTVALAGAGLYARLAATRYTMRAPPEKKKAFG